ncbi:MAG: PIN domain-containing protein [Nitrospirota bacterium]
MSSAAQGKLVLVDTSAWIGFFARTGYSELKARLKKLLDDDHVATAGPIALELLQGCRSTEERTQLERRLRALHWLSTEDRHWFLAGETAFALRRDGITVSAIDALIAILAKAYDCALLHRDSDFDLIARHTPLHLLAVDTR